MNEAATAQLVTLKAVVAVLRSVGVPAWLFGGWGLDAKVGRKTREHGDIEFWVERIHDERSKAALVAAGARLWRRSRQWSPVSSRGTAWTLVLPTSTGEPDGWFQPRGRYSDWLFPPGSFGDDLGTLDGESVPTMSVAGMLAMKEQFPHLRSGAPWRQKDSADIETLRGLLVAGQRS